MRIQLAAAIASAFLLAGCASKPTLVGTWEVAGAMTPMTMTFEDGGKFKAKVDADLPTGGKLNFTGNGTWKVEENTLTTTGTDYTAEGLPALAKTMLDSQWKRTITYTLEWKGNDEISAQAENQALTFVRKKDGG